MPAITPFRVEIPQTDLDDLRDRLGRVRWPDELPEQDYDIAHWTEFDRGGHFSGLEVPDLLAADIRDFFRKLQVP